MIDAKKCWYRNKILSLFNNNTLQSDFFVLSLTYQGGKERFGLSKMFLHHFERKQIIKFNQK